MIQRYAYQCWRHYDIRLVFINQNDVICKFKFCVKVLRWFQIKLRKAYKFKGSISFVWIGRCISVKSNYANQRQIKAFTEAVFQRCSIKKGVLKNFTKFTGKHLCQSLFFNKVAGLPATLLKRDLGTGVFLWVLWNF